MGGKGIKMETKNNQKGGSEKMNVLKDQELFEETCQFCNRKFPAAPHKNQAEQWKKTHEKYCKMNPANKKKK